MSENGKLLTELRRKRIMEILEQQGTVSNDDLAVQLKVSQMTVWRDLTTLEEAGKLRRIRGGALRLDNTPNVEPFYARKRVLHRAKKDLIAQYAATHFIQDNDIIFFEAGTTVLSMIKFLDRANVTLITNGLAAINEAAPSVPDLTLMTCGGFLRDVGHTFVGPQAIQFFQDIRANTFFLSGTGVAIPQGLTDPNVLEIQVKQAMAASANRIVALIDSSKFGVISFAQIVPLEAINVLITDAAAPSESVEQLKALGIDVHIAS